METPIYDFVQRYAAAGNVRLHMPGQRHKLYSSSPGHSHNISKPRSAAAARKALCAFLAAITTGFCEKSFPFKAAARRMPTIRRARLRAFMNMAVNYSGSDLFHLIRENASKPEKALP